MNPSTHTIYVTLVKTSSDASTVSSLSTSSSSSSSSYSPSPLPQQQLVPFQPRHELQPTVLSTVSRPPPVHTFEYGERSYPAPSLPPDSHYLIKAVIQNSIDDRLVTKSILQNSAHDRDMMREMMMKSEQSRDKDREMMKEMMHQNSQMLQSVIQKNDQDRERDREWLRDIMKEATKQTIDNTPRQQIQPSSFQQKNTTHAQTAAPTTVVPTTTAAPTTASQPYLSVPLSPNPLFHPFSPYPSSSSQDNLFAPPPSTPIHHLTPSSQDSLEPPHLPTSQTSLEHRLPSPLGLRSTLAFNHVHHPRAIHPRLQPTNANLSSPLPVNNKRKSPYDENEDDENTTEEKETELKELGDRQKWMKKHLTNVKLTDTRINTDTKNKIGSYRDKIRKHVIQVLWFWYLAPPIEDVNDGTFLPVTYVSITSLITQKYKETNHIRNVVMPILTQYHNNNITKTLEDICQFIYGVVFLLVKLRLKAKHEKDDALEKEYEGYVQQIDAIHQKWGDLVKGITFTNERDIINEEDFRWDTDGNHKEYIDKLIQDMGILLKDGKINYHKDCHKFVQARGSGNSGSHRHKKSRK